MTSATLLTDRSLPAVRLERHLPDPPDVVWRAITARDELRVLEYTWGGETLRFELTPEGEGTRLVLIDELPASAAARNAAGWESCLDRLAGLEPAGDAWQSRFDVYSASFAPSLGEQEGPPAGHRGSEPDVAR